MMEIALRQAETATARGDVIEMMRAYKALKGFEL